MREDQTKTVNIDVEIDGETFFLACLVFLHYEEGRYGGEGHWGETRTFVDMEIDGVYDAKTGEDLTARFKDNDDVRLAIERKL